MAIVQLVLYAENFRDGDHPADLLGKGKVLHAFLLNDATFCNELALFLQREDFAE
jgi:hypothetical protein